MKIPRCYSALIFFVACICLINLSCQTKKKGVADELMDSGLHKSYLKDYNGAIADFTKVINLKPDDAGAYLYRGLAKCDINQYSDAIADFTKTIQIDPKYGEAYNSRGVAYLKLGQKDNARLDFSRAAELGEDVEQADLDACW